MTRPAESGRRSRWTAVLVAVVLLCACGSQSPDLRPKGPIQSIDARSFQDRYAPVITSLTSATSGAGFAWDAAAPTSAVVDKFGICSWRLRQSGTWGGNKGQLRDLRNILNRTLVQNGFHAATWRDDTDPPLFVSQDAANALLEVTLGNPATVDVYSPAAGGTCPSASATP